MKCSVKGAADWIYVPWLVLEQYESLLTIIRYYETNIALSFMPTLAYEQAPRTPTT